MVAGLSGLGSPRVRLWIAFGAVVLVLCWLIRTAVIHASSYYLTVDELAKKGQAAVGKPWTVSGTVVGRSVRWSPARETLVFDMQDESGHAKLHVVFRGPKPDDFDRGWPLVVTGTLRADGTFNAQQLLVKCPSKYEAKSGTYTAVN
ncbi:hypothetical protein GCM10010885_01770 [Alicyclobacillus cellulosilyticus]|uniref:Cytochrome c-type biogenesis protein CcmE n=1 Tax=Alicyclobacillus cellulosilyticus TaxID=1003997 RepID=A0A917K0E4_9BACL|nr:cytochrome c maturation protein CcmE [Alicyclobacillus cellulosilyticus]GGI95760.1 hypothetical protein GCM10010885_01770 [Alicyclobacillus cellulosilyticus]